MAVEDAKTKKNLKTTKKPRKKKHGGVRPNSGRKAQSSKELRDWFVKEVWTPDNREKIKGLIQMHLEKGNWDTIKYLMDQGMGRAPQAVQLSGSVDLPVKTLIIEKIKTDGGKQSNNQAASKAV